MPHRHLIKKDGKEVAIQDKLDFQILEFSSTDKRIALSHIATWEKAKSKPNKKSDVPNTSKDSVPEESTQGYLETLAALKKQGEEDNSQQEQSS